MSNKFKNSQIKPTRQIEILDTTTDFSEDDYKKNIIIKPYAEGAEMIMSRIRRRKLISKIY